MKNKSRGNLLVTFIMVVALSVTVFAFLSYITVRLQESGIRVSEIESFYVADAGINKAVWYLGTPVASGGRGTTWRTASSYEAFGWGGFLLTVADYATNEVKIISTGEVTGITKTISQVVTLGGFPAAFSYSIYCNSGANYTGNVISHGNVYMNGNTAFGKNCSFTNGYVYHPTGTTLSGTGTYTDGGAQTPTPAFPTFDSSYYDGLITTAQGVPAGNQTYNNTTVNLGGSNVYVNGNVTISGNTTINGPGAIVATGQINESGNTYTTSTVKFISGAKLYVAGNAYTTGATYYSATHISAEGNTRVDVGAMLSKGDVALAGNLNLSGIVFAKSGTSFVSGNAAVHGALIASSFGTFSGNANITYDATKFPTDTPIGFTGTSISLKRGTWRGY